MDVIWDGNPSKWEAIGPHGLYEKINDHVKKDTVETLPLQKKTEIISQINPLS